MGCLWGQVLYVVSTTGDGDPPDNCASFYVGLKRQSNRENLLKAKNVRFTVLGLGDQNYTAFMVVRVALWSVLVGHDACAAIVVCVGLTARSWHNTSSFIATPHHTKQGVLGV